MHLVEGVDALIADDPTTFAAKVLKKDAYFLDRKIRLDL